ncbi:uncharacterized protein LOC133791815 [Humulus lupulus]|uniref:uncharacterized protein LOC133791815 n=1 Tax=Humulus lupulus TaxID=3486 RepID=UPI002B4062E8|nr:uncharacterized protein LOC133791815 [Humulus lupulus]
MEALALAMRILSESVQNLQNCYSELKEDVHKIEASINYLLEHVKGRDEDRWRFQGKILQFYFGSCDDIAAGSNLEKGHADEIGVKENEVGHGGDVGKSKDAIVEQDEVAKEKISLADLNVTTGSRRSGGFKSSVESSTSGGSRTVSGSAGGGKLALMRNCFKGQLSLGKLSWTEGNQGCYRVVYVGELILALYSFFHGPVDGMIKQTENSSCQMKRDCASSADRVRSVGGEKRKLESLSDNGGGNIGRGAFQVQKLGPFIVSTPLLDGDYGPLLDYIFDENLDGGYVLSYLSKVFVVCIFGKVGEKLILLHWC